jgi:hypothetical protein
VSGSFFPRTTLSAISIAFEADQPVGTAFLADTQMLLSYRLHRGTVYFQRGNVAIDYSKHFTALVKLN